MAARAAEVSAGSFGRTEIIAPTGGVDDGPGWRVVRGLRGHRRRWLARPCVDPDPAACTRAPTRARRATTSAWPPRLPTTTSKARKRCRCRCSANPKQAVHVARHDGKPAGLRQRAAGTHAFDATTLVAANAYYRRLQDPRHEQQRQRRVRAAPRRPFGGVQSAQSDADTGPWGASLQADLARRDMGGGGPSGRRRRRATTPAPPTFAQSANSRRPSPATARP